jgi:hypothetical protein
MLHPPGGVPLPENGATGIQMVLKPADAPSEPSPWLASDVARAILQFISGVRPIRSVQRVAYSADGGQIDLWVLQSTEDLEDAERIYLLERSLRQRAGLLPLTLHVIPLSEVDEADLPPSETIHERQ